MFSSSGTVIALSTADCKFSFQQLIAIKLSLSEIKKNRWGQRRRQDISKRYPISISVEKVYLANFYVLFMYCISNLFLNTNFAIMYKLLHVN